VHDTHEAHEAHEALEALEAHEAHEALEALEATSLPLQVVENVSVPDWRNTPLLDDEPKSFNAMNLTME
jgi:hypothetical protein